MKQSEIIAAGEADAWLDRNRDKIKIEDDPVLKLIHGDMNVRSVLEVGSSNGWRLKEIHKRFGCMVTGIEPGERAREESRMNGVPAYAGTADNLPVNSDIFDIVILGFCMYLVDPCDYFKVAAEADRVLKDGGHLIIYDFNEWKTFKRPYKHDYRLFSYHFSPSAIWTAHPGYAMVRCEGRYESNEIAVLLKKDMANAFPLEADV